MSDKEIKIKRKHLFTAIYLIIAVILSYNIAVWYVVDSSYPYFYKSDFVCIIDEGLYQPMKVEGGEYFKIKTAFQTEIKVDTKLDIKSCEELIKKGNLNELANKLDRKYLWIWTFVYFTGFIIVALPFYLGYKFKIVK